MKQPESAATTPPSGWRSHLRAQLPAILVETFSVVLAVLLALGINEWREVRGHERLAAVQTLTAAIREASAGERRLIHVDFVAEQLRNAAWQTTILTDAARYMDFERVSELSDIYQLQELVDDMVRELLLMMTSPELQDEERRLAALRRYASSVGQLVAVEEQLLELYEDYLGTDGRQEP